MEPMRRSIVVLLLAAGGCITLRTGKAHYVAGESADVTLANHSLRKIAWGVCVNRPEKYDMELQRFEAGLWKTVPRSTDDDVCVDLDYEMRFGELGSKFNLKPELPSGTYRLSASDLRWGGVHQALVTESFLVEK